MPTIYIAARWMDAEHTGILATGDDGSISFVQDAGSKVSPWPEFLTEHGISAIREPPQPEPKEEPS